MQKSESRQTTSNVRRQVRQSTTLNRRYVKKPVGRTDGMVAIKRSPNVSRFNSHTAQTTSIRTQAKTEKIEKFSSHPLQQTANARLRARQQAPAQPKKLTAKELKDQAIKKALAAAERQTPLTQQATTEAAQPKGKIRFGLGRIVLALSCAAAAVFAIVYFVNLNMPDISFRVAAMQTGINASYPSYLPRGFSLSGITSEDSKITLSFKNAEEDKTFSIIEEKSHWDSGALLSNFVKQNYREDYTVVRERGLTIYISESNAAWVNGGVVYKIEAEPNLLTKKHICSIATSL